VEKHKFERTWGEEVDELADMADQLAAQQGVPSQGQHYLEVAAMLLLMREVKWLRRHLSGEDT